MLRHVLRPNVSLCLAKAGCFVLMALQLVSCSVQDTNKDGDTSSDTSSESKTQEPIADVISNIVGEAGEDGIPTALRGLEISAALNSDTPISANIFLVEASKDQKIFTFTPPEGYKASFSSPVLLGITALDSAPECSEQNYAEAEPTYGNVASFIKQESLCGTVFFNFCGKLVANANSNITGYFKTPAIATAVVCKEIVAPPKIAAGYPGPLRFQIGDSVNVGLIDAPGDVTNCYLKEGSLKTPGGVASGITVDPLTCTLKGTANQAGTFANLVVEAENASGKSATSSFTLEIKPVSYAPVIKYVDSTDPIEYWAATYFSLPIINSAPAGGEIVSCSYTGGPLPVQITFDTSTCEIKGSAIEVGETEITVTATNGDGKSSVPLNVKIVVNPNS